MSLQDDYVAKQFCDDILEVLKKYGVESASVFALQENGDMDSFCVRKTEDDKLAEFLYCSMIDLFQEVIDSIKEGNDTEDHDIETGNATFIVKNRVLH